MQTTDLIYLSDSLEYDEAKKELSAAFPRMIITDASDEIHPYRFSITLDVDRDELNMWLLYHGYHEVSLNLGLFRANTPDKFNDIVNQALRIFAEVNAGKVKVK